MHPTNKNPSGIDIPAGVQTHKRLDYAHCLCSGQTLCSACTHLALIARHGPGYRAWMPPAKAVGLALVLVLTVATTCGTMAASHASGPVRRNTMNVAVATPTESGVLSCPDSGAGRHSLVAMPQGFGQGAPFREGGGMATFMLRTPCPPDARRSADGGFLSHVGA